MNRAARDIAVVVAARLAMSSAVWWGGFRAVSDDDFARVVHAQEFALSPALDPTGTSWLPLPFWLTGGVMTVAGTDIAVARAVAWALGIASSLLVYAAARILVDNRDGALLGALVATILPWSVRLGVATVPELPAAALTVFALATLAREDPRLRSWGAAALVAATLCRYEPWIAAAGFAAFSVWDGLRSDRGRLRYGAAVALSCVGPVGWIIHNAVAHGDAFHFLARVSAYKRAIGGTTSFWEVLAGYPLSLLREEPELCILAVVFVASRRSIPRSFRRPAYVVAAMLAMLSLAALPGGAPTHHVGRAVLSIWLLLAIGVGEGARVALASEHRLRFAALVVVLMPVGALVLRPWYSRLDSFITRTDEVAIGRAVAARLGDGSALVEARDYGFFAIEAGTGVPPRVLIDRNVDPREARQASSFESVAALRRRAEDRDASVVVGHVTPVTRALGRPFASAGPWGAWELTRSDSATPPPR